MTLELDFTTFRQKTAEFFETYPLYRTLQFSGEVAPHGRAYASPEIKTHCTVCGSIQRWNGGEDVGFDRDQPGYRQVTYRCKNCSSASVAYFVWVDIKRGMLTKVGQYPALERTPPKALSAIMSEDDLRLYRQALTCRRSRSWSADKSTPDGKA